MFQILLIVYFSYADTSMNENSEDSEKEGHLAKQFSSLSFHNYFLSYHGVW